MGRYAAIASAMLVAIAACFIKPDPPAKDDGGVVTDDGGSAACETVVFASMMATGCGTSLAPSTLLNGAAHQANSKLVLSLFSGAFTARAACTSLRDRLDSATVRIENVAAGTYDSTEFVVFDGAGGRFGVTFRESANLYPEFRIECDGLGVATPWNAAQHAVFRIRRGSGDQIAIGVGPNQGSLTETMCPADVARLDSNTRVELMIERGSAGSSENGVFSELELCR